MANKSFPINKVRIYKDERDKDILYPYTLVFLDDSDKLRCRGKYLDVGINEELKTFLVSCWGEIPLGTGINSDNFYLGTRKYLKSLPLFAQKFIQEICDSYYE